MSQISTFKLLAVDHDAQSLALIIEALAQEGLEILTASGTEPGFEIFLQARPRTVVLSLAQPEAHGMDLLERLVRADPGVNVILIADHYSTEFRRRGDSKRRMRLPHEADRLSKASAPDCQFSGGSGDPPEDVELGPGTAGGLSI